MVLPGRVWPGLRHVVRPSEVVPLTMLVGIW